MAFEKTWDEDSPDGGLITVSLLDNYIRETRFAVRERMEGDPADPLTGIIEEGTWALGPKIKQGAARLYVTEIADIGDLDLEDGRAAFVVDDVDFPRLYHMATAGEKEVGYLNIDGVRPMEGHLLFTPDDTYDIGAFEATRPRQIYVVDAVRIGTGSAFVTLSPFGCVGEDGVDGDFYVGPPPLSEGTLTLGNSTCTILFHGGAGLGVPVTGSKGGNAALTSLCSQLNLMGLIDDNTS